MTSDEWRWPDGLYVNVLREPNTGEPHPLYGLWVALAAAKGPLALVVPCDVPQVSTALLCDLAARGRPVVAVCEGRRHPLVGVFDTARAKAAYAGAVAGQSLHHFTRSMQAVEVPAAQLHNVNSAEDLTP